jgi:hypothetical protein
VRLFENRWVPGYHPASRAEGAVCAKGFRRKKAPLPNEAKHFTPKTSCKSWQGNSLQFLRPALAYLNYPPLSRVKRCFFTTIKPNQAEKDRGGAAKLAQNPAQSCLLFCTNPIDHPQSVASSPRIAPVPGRSNPRTPPIQECPCAFPEWTLLRPGTGAPRDQIGRVPSQIIHNPVFSLFIIHYSLFILPWVCP